MSYKSELMKLWTRPECYIGASWSEYYVFLGQHRDSDTLTRSNFISGLNAIGGETETVLTIQENHWAVGWIEWIAIHQSDEIALCAADETMASLEDYPVVDENHWSELEYGECCDYWEQCSLQDRIELCSKHDISIFAARSDCIPGTDNGYLLETLQSYVNS